MLDDRCEMCGRGQCQGKVQNDYCDEGKVLEGG